MRAISFLLLLCIHLNFFVEFAHSNRHWEKFKLNNNITYSSPCEEIKRKQIFIQKLKDIDAWNRAYIRGEVTWYRRVDQYSDLTAEEFRKFFRCQIRMKQISKSGPKLDYDTPIVRQSLPESFKIVDSPLRFQGYFCDSCWAFAAVASVESCLQIKTGKAVDLSEKLLVDCTYKKCRSGCLASYREDALDYMDIKFALDEASMPYTPFYKLCDWPKDASKQRPMNIVYDYVLPNLTGIKQVIKQYGSISVITNIDLWWGYAGGVITAPLNHDLTNHPPTHAVNIVGWGTYAVNYVQVNPEIREHWIIRDTLGFGYLRYDIKTSERIIDYGTTIAVTTCTFEEVTTTPPPTSTPPECESTSDSPSGSFENPKSSSTKPSSPKSTSNAWTESLSEHVSSIPTLTGSIISSDPTEGPPPSEYPEPSLSSKRGICGTSKSTTPTTTVDPCECPEKCLFFFDPLAG